MKPDKKIIFLIGLLWGVLIMLVYANEFLHSVLHINILPESIAFRITVVFVIGFLLTLSILIAKGYLTFTLNLDESKIRHTKFSLIDDIINAEKSGQFERAISLGKSICRTLYIEGYLKLRYEIGKIIQNAAVKTKNRKVEMEAYIDFIGWSLVLMKQYDNSKAIDYINHGLTLASDIPREFYWLAKGTRHLGAIKFIEHKYIEAESIFQEALTFANDINDAKLKNEMIAGIYFDMALIRLNLNDKITAKRLCTDCRLLREDVGDMSRICRMFALEGKIHEAENDRIKALNSFTEGLHYAQLQSRKDEIIRNHIGLARVLKDEDVEKAKFHYEEARKLMTDTDVPFDIYGEEKIPML